MSLTITDYQVFLRLVVGRPTACRCAAHSPRLEGAGVSALLGSVLLDGRLSGSVWLGGQLSGIPRAIGGEGQYTKKWIKYGVWMATGLHGRHGISLSRTCTPCVGWTRERMVLLLAPCCVCFPGGSVSRPHNSRFFQRIPSRVTWLQQAARGVSMLVGSAGPGNGNLTSRCKDTSPQPKKICPHVGARSVYYNADHRARQ
jgi:hypothetical protein